MADGVPVTAQVLSTKNSGYKAWGEPIGEEMKSSVDPWHSVRVVIAVLFAVVPLMLAAMWILVLSIR